MLLLDEAAIAADLVTLVHK